MITIYYMEDDEDIAGTVREFLENRGLRVLVFSSISDTKEALQKACPGGRILRAAG